jgi:CBS domain containing-hemolysin-like protein
MAHHALDTAVAFAVPLLVIMNAFFVAIEFALVSVRWTRIEQLVEQGRPGAKLAAGLVENLNDSLAATQLGITLASLALGWVGEPTIGHALMPFFDGLPIPWNAALAHGTAIGVAFLCITYLHIVLGELVPRAIALQYAEKIVLLFAAPLLAFRAVTRPLVEFMRGSVVLAVRLLRVPAPPKESQVHSPDEIDMLIKEGQEAGVIQPDEAKYARAVFELSDRKVRDVMVPRDKVVALSRNAKPEEILETARMSAHTRMPVWEGGPDNIVGVVNTKDLFHIFSLMGLVILEDAMYPALYIDPEQSLGRALNMFRRERRHMAVVRAMDLRFQGILTLEDIIEEIVGEIEDEHD